MTRLTTRLLLLGGGIALSLVTALPAAAQVICPPGYYYSYGYGCVPASDAYDDMYGDGYAYGPPVYDSYGMAFGFGGGSRGRIAGGRGGGGHVGGGGHAGGGGGRAGGGGHGGGHH